MNTGSNISNQQEFTGSTDSATCALGKWLASDTSKTDDPELSTLFSQVTIPHDYIHNEAKAINELHAAGDYEGALQYLEENILPHTNETIGMIVQIEYRYEDILTEIGEKITSLQRTVTLLISILFIVAIAVNVILAYAIIRSIMAPLRRITACSEELALGG